MTLDKMIQSLTYCSMGNHGGVWMTKEQGESIIVALKAGQALTDKAKEAIKELEHGYETCGLIVDMRPLVKAWDVALRDDK